jgi:hypothetical protein
MVETPPTVARRFERSQESWVTRPKELPRTADEDFEEDAERLGESRTGDL